ncbi:hypothetical protein SFUMM280S_07855 [Streptomyces fumanus]
MLRVWGAWAVVAGLVQLIVAVPRRKLGGQWPMILSGGISVLAGGSFIASAGADDPALTSAVGYAVPGRHLLPPLGPAPEARRPEALNRPARRHGRVWGT